jgi:hypothetical protein
MNLEYLVGNNDSITLPLFGTVNVVVDWGDLSSDTYLTIGEKTHTYTNAGTYNVIITGNLTIFGNGLDGNTSNFSKLKRVISFGNIGLIQLYGAFKDATSLYQVPTVLPTTITSLKYAFYGATIFNDPNILAWNVSNIIDMSFMFYNADAFNQPISNWTVSNLVKIDFMLYSAKNYIEQPSGWIFNRMITLTGNY